MPSTSNSRGTPGPATVELLVLAHASLSTRKLSTLLEHHLTPADFLWHPQIFDFLSDTFSRTEHLPAPALVAALFPSLPLAEIETTSFEGALEHLLENVRGTRLVKLLTQVSTQYSRTGDASGAHSALLEGIPGLSPGLGPGSSQMDHSSQNRWHLYQSRKDAFSSYRMVGMRTGLAVFDSMARGWETGELTGIIARPHVGKSWVLCHSAATAYREGKRILFVSPEMAADEVGLRADQLLFPQWQGNRHGDTLPLQELMTGQLSGRVEEAYRAYLDELSREDRWTTIDSSSDRGIRVSIIDQLIVSHAPDIVCIDGLMLLDSHYEAVWEKAKDIAYTLKNVAMHRHIPIVFVAQSNRTTRERNDIPSLSEIAFGDSIGQACDRMVGLGMPPTGAVTARLLQCQKFRNGWANFHRRQTISFSPDQGDIGRIVPDLVQDDVEIEDQPEF